MEHLLIYTAEQYRSVLINTMEVVKRSFGSISMPSFYIEFRAYDRIRTRMHFRKTWQETHGAQGVYALAGSVDALRYLGANYSVRYLIARDIPIRYVMEFKRLHPELRHLHIQGTRTDMQTIDITGLTHFSATELGQVTINASQIMTYLDLRVDPSRPSDVKISMPSGLLYAVAPDYLIDGCDLSRIKHLDISQSCQGVLSSDIPIDLLNGPHIQTLKLDFVLYEDLQYILDIESLIHLEINSVYTQYEPLDLHELYIGDTVIVSMRFRQIGPLSGSLPFEGGHELVQLILLTEADDARVFYDHVPVKHLAELKNLTVSYIPDGWNTASRALSEVTVISLEDAPRTN